MPLLGPDRWVRPESIRIEFVDHGATAPEPTGGMDRLYLDVGNALQPGVIDHHLTAYIGAATGLVLQHPEFVRDSLSPDREEGDPFTVVVHRQPDLDCVAASFLAIHYLTKGCFPDRAEVLAGYVDQVDSGFVGASQAHPYSLYTAWMLLLHHLSLCHWESQQSLWTESVRKGHQVILHVLRKVGETDDSILEVDAFDTPGLFGPRERDEIRQDIARYRRKLADPGSRARKLKLRLGHQLGGRRLVDALFVRDVQNEGDLERVIFFKDWARSDSGNAPGSSGFVALTVSMATTEGRNRSILSVRPDSGFCLRGLGALLDEAEAAARRELYGTDDRVEDPETRKPKACRPGYGNADPWYDGRGHGYTILDSPRSGSLLSPDRVEAIFEDYAGGSEAGVESLPLPSLGHLAEGDGLAEHELGVLADYSIGLATYLQGSAARARDAACKVFISYPSTELPWVRDRLYWPLLESLDSEAVFFDKTSLEAGYGWLARLASEISTCRIFVAVYCRDYFRSEICQWELQLAVLRDPIGCKGLVLPMTFDKMRPPDYCKLIQAEKVTRDDVDGYLRKILAAVRP